VDNEPTCLLTLVALAAALNVRLNYSGQTFNTSYKSNIAHVPLQRNFTIAVRERRVPTCSKVCTRDVVNGGDNLTTVACLAAAAAVLYSSVAGGRMS
jgi:hypothetical protein